MISVTYNDILEKYPNYEKLCRYFIDMGKTNEDKIIIKEILLNGGYKTFNVNTHLSNYKYKISNEVSRRLSIVEILLFNKPLFNFFLENNINIFHGTYISTLPNILKYGVMSCEDMHENNIEITTGEYLSYIKKFKEIYTDLTDSDFVYRNFISLTDDFSIAKNYSIENSSKKEISIIICFSETVIKNKYKDFVIYVDSLMTEIGMLKSIAVEDISCIITSPNYINYVKEAADFKNIPVFEYSLNQTLKLNFNKDNLGFYNLSEKSIEINEELFDKCMESIEANSKKLEDKTSHKLR